MSTNGKEYDEFDDFAKNIIDEIIKLGVGREEAVSIFNKYLPIYEVLADDHLEDESFYAAQFHDAHLENFSPEQWMEKIQKIDAMFGENVVEDDFEEGQSETVVTLKSLPTGVGKTATAANGWLIRPRELSTEFTPRLFTLRKSKHMTKNE